MQAYPSCQKSNQPTVHLTVHTHSWTPQTKNVRPLLTIEATNAKRITVKATKAIQLMRSDWMDTFSPSAIFQFNRLIWDWSRNWRLEQKWRGNVKIRFPRWAFVIQLVCFRLLSKRGTLAVKSIDFKLWGRGKKIQRLHAGSLPFLPCPLAFALILART